MEKQIADFKPEVVSVGSPEFAAELKSRLQGKKTAVYSGSAGLDAVTSIPGTDLVLNAIVGIAGLMPTVMALNNGIAVALANKETLVAAGEIVMDLAKEKQAAVIPVDSEHSAIFQCLRGNRAEDVENIWLTASGGPFRGLTYSEMKNKTPEEALRHPNWKMGKKITVDSATMMNKGLEIIEASRIFGLGPDNIKVLIHPQSIVHSMVEYSDGSVIAQLGYPDMRIPIQYAMTYPARMPASYKKLDLTKIGKLDFGEADMKAFPCIRLACEALKEGGTMPAVLNGANEKAVELFLAGEIGFTDIPETVEKVMEKHKTVRKPVLEDIVESDFWARHEEGRISGELA